MIAIGPVSGPGVMQHEDRWGWPVNSYETLPWFWLDEEDWDQVNWYQTATPYDEKTDYIEVFNNPEHPIHKEIKAKVVYGGMSTLKQMNVKNMDGEQMRIVIPMGLDKSKPHYRPWTFWERTIGYRLSKLQARLLNR